MAPTYAPCPRPILKRPHTTADCSSSPAPAVRDASSELLAIDRSILHPVVRFPHQAVSKTFSALSPSQYDRSPIVVQPNTCALPARGCPGRTYTLDADDDSDAESERRRRAFRACTRTRSPMGRHLHPRAVASPPIPRCADDEDEDDDPTPRATPVAAPPPLPPLIPDLSSESDESDGATGPLCAPAVPGSYSRTGLALPRAKDADGLGLRVGALHIAGAHDALSFLPHAPAPRPRPAHGHGHPPEEERARKSASPSRASPPRRRVVRTSADQGRYKALSERSALSGCALDIPDQGCFGGF